MATQNLRTSIKISDERDDEAKPLAVFSLEPWEEVRRRIRILVDEIVDIDPLLLALYVRPAMNMPRRLSHGKFADPSARRLEKVHPRIHVLRPQGSLPRSVGPLADLCLGRQVLDAVGELRPAPTGVIGPRTPICTPHACGVPAIVGGTPYSQQGWCDPPKVRNP
jgi:hypothetical protein